MISLVDPIDTNPEIVLYIIYPDLLASRFHCIYISDHIYIYVYICICHWLLAFFKKARVHPERARPKLDLVVHQVLQAFPPQMPGAYQKPPEEKYGQMAILGSPLDGPWKWSRWWFLSKEIEWKKITLWFLVFGGLLCGRVCFQHLHSIPTRKPYKKTLHDCISTKWLDLCTLHIFSAASIGSILDPQCFGIQKIISRCGSWQSQHHEPLSLSAPCWISGTCCVQAIPQIMNRITT